MLESPARTARPPWAMVSFALRRMAMPVRRREFLASAALPFVLPLDLPRALLAASEPPLPRLRAVSYRQVHLADGFWAPRQRTMREATVPHLFRELEQAGQVSNFQRAAAGAKEGYRGPVYMDSDLYKSLEAASYVLGLGPDTAIAATVEKLA